MLSDSFPFQHQRAAYRCPLFYSFSSFFSSIPNLLICFFLFQIRIPVIPAADNTRMAIHRTVFAVSPVFGGLLVFVVVPGVSGVGVSGTSLMVTVCPSSLMSLCFLFMMINIHLQYNTNNLKSHKYDSYFLSIQDSQ